METGSARLNELAPWFLDSLPEAQRGPWLEAFAEAGFDTASLSGNALAIGMDNGEGLLQTWDQWTVAMLAPDADAANLAAEVELSGENAGQEAVAFLVAVRDDQRGRIDVAPFLEALGPDVWSDPYAAHVLGLYGVEPPR